MPHPMLSCMSDASFLQDRYKLGNKCIQDRKFPKASIYCGGEKRPILEVVLLVELCWIVYKQQKRYTGL
jgi:hypothetical protein